jgi:hypothetical protein
VLTGLGLILGSGGWTSLAQNDPLATSAAAMALEGVGPEAAQVNARPDLATSSQMLTASLNAPDCFREASMDGKSRTMWRC